MDQAPFDASTMVDAEELAEWLRLEAGEVRALTLAGVLKLGRGWHVPAGGGDQGLHPI
jgi:hypothetical protein